MLKILETRNQVCLWCHIKSILLFFQNNPEWLYRIPADMLIASYSTVGLSIHIKMLAFQKIIITKESIKYDLCLLLLLYGAEIFVLSYYFPNKKCFIKKIEKKRRNFLPHLKGYRKFKFIW